MNGDSQSSEKPAQPATPGSTIALPPLGEQPGARIGRYKLLQQIGEGGCGVVFMAEQSEPVRRKVALKVIKLGMDTKQVVARFEAERQALAMMDHPNIAKVLDGGATDTGRPFFVMELVAGIKLTDYCDKHKLSTHDRLDLFIQVCHAIQHAHQKGIIHRDIKPSNVLVTLDLTHKPLPKVIDFGIAKATTGQALTDKTLFTAYEQFIGTPAYMSPEQADLTGLDIDTRTDIYSLGVLLYELLTGKTPFDTDELMRGGVETLRQTLRDKEATTPSMRLKHLTPTDLTQVAERHHVKAPELIHTVRGDLDWIVLKCLEKDRTRRYETANGIAMDLQRYLNNEPIVARPPSTLYRFGKMVRRNKVAFTAVNAVALAIAIGFGVSTRLYLKEKAARAEVLAQKQRADEKSVLAERAKNEAEANAAEAQQQRKAAETANRATRETLKALRLQSARAAFADDNAALGLAYLALVLRQEPTNRFVGPWIVSALSQLNFAMPSSWSVPMRAGFCQYSPDGRFVALASSDGYALVVNASNGKPVTPELRHEAGVIEARFSPDGRRLVTASADTTARVWDVATGKPIGEPMKHLGRVKSARFSPDGKRVATGSVTGMARVWDAETGTPITPVLSHAREVDCIQFSHGGDLIATAAQDGLAVIWDAVSGGKKNALRSRRGALAWIEFSPDDALLALGESGGTVSIWKTADGIELARHSIHEGPVTKLSFSPDGHRIASASQDKTARILEIETGSVIAPPFQHRTTLKLAIFDPNGLKLATVTDGQRCRVWDASNGQLLADLVAGNYVDFSVDGQRLFTAKVAGGCRAWDVRYGSEFALRFKDLSEARKPTPGLLFGGGCFSPDGKWVITAGGSTPRVGDIATGKPTLRSPGGEIRAIECSPDGKWIACLSSSGSGPTDLRIWDFATGQPVGRLIKHERQINTVRFSPDGLMIATASTDNTARVWDAKTGQPISPIIKGSDRASWAEFSPDGKRLAVASGIQVRVVSVTTAAEETGIKSPTRNLFTRARFSPDGRRIVTADNSGIRVWDSISGNPITAQVNTRGRVRSVEFSRDGRRILTAGANQTAEIWDAETGALLAPPMTHAAEVEDAKFSPDGRRVATASGNAVRVWDAQTGQALTEPLVHDGPVHTVHFSPDGQRLLASSTDGYARLWEVPAITTPAPAWLPLLAQAMAGAWFEGDGTYRTSSFTNLFAIKRQLEASTADDDYTRWGKWFFADRSTRTISAWSPVTMPEYVQLRIAEGSVESLREAVLLLPNHAYNLARYARKLADQNPAQHPRARGEADFLSRRALTLAPNDTNVQRLRAEVEQKIGDVKKP